MNTQYINRVELQGRVGTVRISGVCDTLVANFSILTERLYKTGDGNQVMEATWMSVAAFEGNGVSISGLTRGSLVNLTGRLRNNKYIDASGNERVFTEVIATSLKVLG